MISIFLIDDLAPMRTLLRLRFALEDDIFVIGDGGSGEETLAQIRATGPQVVILDLLTPILDFASAATLLGDLAPAAEVVVLSLYDDPITRESLLHAGAAAVVSKHDADDVLLATIRSVSTTPQTGTL